MEIHNEIYINFIELENRDCFGRSTKQNKTNIDDDDDEEWQFSFAGIARW